MELDEGDKQSVSCTYGDSISEPPENEKPVSFESNLDMITATPVYTTGWRLYVMILCAALCNFLVNMEVSIIGTSLVSITNDLHDFNQMGWIVTGYLITYTGLLIIWAKISDIFGRKPVMVVAILVFTVFSGACGAAQTMIQLIIFRAFQGIGAAGSVCLALITAYEMVPRDQYPAQAARIGSATTIGSLVGPLIGGGVSEKSTWRWVFLINVPAGMVTVILTLISVPNGFPHHGTEQVPYSYRKKFSKNNLLRLDLLGATLLLGASLTFVAVLLEAGTEFSWNSGKAISLLVISALLCALFLVHERIVTSDQSKQEPIFPWRYLSNRAWMGTLLLSLLSGIPYNVMVVDMPQRFQVVNNIDPFGASVRLIPFTFSLAIGNIVANIIAKKARIRVIYLLLFGSIVQLIGLSLFTTLPEDRTLGVAVYGYEVLTGFGIGWVMGVLLLLPPAVAEKRDLAISAGGLLQFRVLGGAIGLAIASAVINNYLRSHLGPLIGADNLALVLQSTAEIRNLPAAFQKDTVAAFTHGYNLQMKVNVAFSIVQVLAVGLIWRKTQIEVLDARSKATDS